ncbi:MAG: hypothetical protein U1F15_11510 [Burkholderiales bacterium]
MNRRSFVAGVAGGVLGASAAARAQEASVRTSIYNRNLATPEFVWDRIYGPPLTPGANGFISEGPWGIDTNHMEFGLLVGPAVLYCDGRASGLPEKPNLIDATIQLEVEFRENQHLDSPPLKDIGAQLVFWFQTYLISEFDSNPTRTFNYIWPRDLLADEPAIHLKRSLRLSRSLADWTCLGRQRRDVRRDDLGNFNGSASKYSCALNQGEFESAMKSVNADLGVLLIVDWKRWRSLDPTLKNGRAWSRAWDDTLPQRKVLGDSVLVLHHFSINR